MNQELMTLDFWQDTIIYEEKTLPTGTLACDTLNVSAETLTYMSQQWVKINLLFGLLKAKQDGLCMTWGRVGSWKGRPTFEHDENKWLCEQGDSVSFELRKREAAQGNNGCF